MIFSIALNREMILRRAMEKIYDINALARIMEKLRDPKKGCEWDIAQDFKSIAPYTIEEAYEVADAIERNDKEDLADELGDLLLQVIFHSQMAREEGSFDLQNVIDNICGKMIRRHPHIFDDSGEFKNDKNAVRENWERIKENERFNKDRSASALDGVAIALPALKRAEKIQKRAARTGFDWPDSAGAKTKILEELQEVEEAQSDAETFDEIGDLLFSVVNYSRHKGIDPEEAMKAATQKFVGRFKEMERIAIEESETFSDLALNEKEALWLRAKRR